MSKNGVDFWICETYFFKIIVIQGKNSLKMTLYHLFFWQHTVQKENCVHVAFAGGVLQQKRYNHWNQMCSAFCWMVFNTSFMDNIDRTTGGNPFIFILLLSNISPVDFLYNLCMKHIKTTNGPWWSYCLSS